MSFDEIAECATEYAAVKQQLALSEHDGSGDTAAADRLLAARLRLAQCLLRAGWTPNAEVVATLRLDRAVLTESLGSAHLAHFSPS